MGAILKNYPFYLGARSPDYKMTPTMKFVCTIPWMIFNTAKLLFIVKLLRKYKLNIISLLFVSQTIFLIVNIFFIVKMTFDNKPYRPWAYH